MSDDLYPTEVLRLAAQLPADGKLNNADGATRKRSMVCGSQVEVSLLLDREGRIQDLGLDVEACVLGQAAASILARHAVGASLDEVRDARDGLDAMLRQGAPPPTGRFAELAELASVREYPRRHASTMLAFRAAAEAMELALASRTDVSS